MERDVFLGAEGYRLQAPGVAARVVPFVRNEPFREREGNEDRREDSRRFELGSGRECVVLTQ